MNLYPNTYYHLYNRTNGNEALFRTRHNYAYFLKKYRHYLDAHVSTLAYCLMPTHFHAFVFVRTSDIPSLSKAVGTLLSSYTLGFNKTYKRHGNLFQQHTKAKIVGDERYAATLAAYIHNNPVRAGLVAMPEEWEFSSCSDYFGVRNGTLVEQDLILSGFSSREEFCAFSRAIANVEARYWV